MKKKKDNKDFDFKDLMAFGMFILALLTFVYLICHSCYKGIEKPPLKLWRVNRVEFLS